MHAPSIAVRRRVAAAVGRLRAGRPPSRVAPAEVNDPVKAAIERDLADSAHMTRLLAFVLARDANCIDIGANHGAVLAEMRRVAPDGHHIAFEPLPHLCELLRRTFPDVEIRQAALYNEAGQAEFSYVHGSADGWSGLHFRPLPGGQQAEVEEIQVRVEVLDDVLDPDYRPAVIKIDVEGAELQVLQGALRTLRQYAPIVIFEHGSGSAESYGTGPGDVYRLLTCEAGMRVFDLDGSGPYTLEQFERAFYTAERVNFVARP